VVLAKEQLAANKGKFPTFVQTKFASGGAEQLVTLKLGTEYTVKLTQRLVEDLRTRLGNEHVDLAGAGSKRKRRLEQQRLFREEAEAAPVESSAPVLSSDDAAAMAMDLEMAAAE